MDISRGSSIDGMSDRETTGSAVDKCQTADDGLCKVRKGVSKEAEAHQTQAWLRASNVLRWHVFFFFYSCSALATQRLHELRHGRLSSPRIKDAVGAWGHRRACLSATQRNCAAS